MKQLLLTLVLITMSVLQSVQATDYVIDTEKAHAFIDFRIQHLGFSWMSGRFNDFSGTFSYDDANPEASKIRVSIDVSSIDTNHAERDKHLRGKKYLDVKHFPEAQFISTSFEQQQDGQLLMTGDFTLHGVTRSMTFPIEKVGQGNDPWGGYRLGFIGETQFTIADYEIDVGILGPASQVVYLTLSIEGVAIKAGEQLKKIPSIQ